MCQSAEAMVAELQGRVKEGSALLLAAMELSVPHQGVLEDSIWHHICRRAAVVQLGGELCIFGPGGGKVALQLLLLGHQPGSCSAATALRPFGRLT